jgi:hypothetical protein
MALLVIRARGWWLGWACVWALGLAAPVLVTLAARLHSPVVPGMGGRRGLREGAGGGGALGRAYSPCSNSRLETEELNCRAQAGARRGLAVRAWLLSQESCCATCYQACVAAHLQRVHVNNYVTRLVLKHEPRSLAPLRAFGWRKPVRKNAE